MSSQMGEESKKAVATNRSIAQSFYDIATPALQRRQDEINRAMVEGEPSYMRAAFLGQRGALTDAMAGKAGTAQRQQWLGGKASLSGGNFAAGLNPADYGAQLANALYGSKFAEGQANIDQQFNLMGMALGGAGTAGSSGLASAQQQLQTIGYMPAYNQTYANVIGGLAGAASAYGAYNQNQAYQGWLGRQSLTPYGQVFGLPTATTFPSTYVGNPGGG